MVTTETNIGSQSYILGIRQENQIQSIYKNYYNRIAAKTTDPKSRKKWIFPAWPDWNLDNSDSYPIIIINSPEVYWSDYGITRTQVDYNISVDIFSTSSSEMDALADQVMTAIELSKNDFWIAGLKFTFVDSTDTNHFLRSKITVHQKTITFNGKYWMNEGKL